MKAVAVVFAFLIFGASGYSQHQDGDENGNMYKGRFTQSEDTTSLLHAFKEGSFHGHFRYFFMATDNAHGLKDFVANAAGGGIRFETAKFKNFQMAISGFYIFNVGSTNLSVPDAQTGVHSRYEIALFDVEDLNNKKDIDRLEELYLKYNFKRSIVIFGRQLINTPFINLQDGRMRPTGVEGLWTEINELKNVKIEGGWLYAISPRSTVEWYNPGESIGVYSSGVHIDGTPSDYTHHTNSKGVGVIGLTAKPVEKLKVQAWNIYTENVFNTMMFQADINFADHDEEGYFGALQFIRQDVVNQGGNNDPDKAYFPQGGKAFTFGAKLGWTNKSFETSLNYNRITAHGRYLFPREWGNDPFFTFLPRERNDGFGDLHSVMGKVAYKIPSAMIKTSLAAGYYHLPDIMNYRLNKYSIPSYVQINATFNYTFSGILKGLDSYILFVSKLGSANSYGNKKFEINKVNMEQYNVVFNYHF